MTSSYAAAGVDVEAGERAVALMRASIEATRRSEVVGGFGGFAGLFDASALKSMSKPLLATSTDGVGTKVAIAQALDKHDTIGIDLVAMVIDDIVVCGAEPLFMTDYIATGSVVPERIAAIVQGIADGCAQAGCALIGGETAEHPGLLGPDEYDLAGAGTGIVEADRLLGADKVRDGDAIVAMTSSGLHSNGYSLARQVFLSSARWSLEREVDEFGRTLGEELLEPTTIYTRAWLDLINTDDAAVHALSHITGGGIAANIARVLPADLHAEIQRDTWSPPPVFRVLQELGSISALDMESTLNMGMGMAVVLPEQFVDSAHEACAQHGITMWRAGTVRQRRDGESGDAPAKGGGGGSATLVGTYA